MSQQNASTALPPVVHAKPLQTAKFVGILLSLVLGVAGFFRLIDARAVFGGSPLGDGQFLALLLIPVISVLLVLVVVLETLVAGYRIVRSAASPGEQLSGRVGYLLIRGVEAAIALGGTTVIVTALPVLVADDTPAPAGVGVMLLLMAVGLGILVASFIRAGAEIFVYGTTPTDD